LFNSKLHDRKLGFNTPLSDVCKMKKIIHLQSITCINASVLLFSKGKVVAHFQFLPFIFTQF